jgi:hypothetical protein
VDVLLNLSTARAKKAANGHYRITDFGMDPIFLRGDMKFIS